MTKERASEGLESTPAIKPRAPAHESAPGPQPKHQPAPAQEPSKNAPTFPPGSPENVPPGPTSA